MVDNACGMGYVVRMPKLGLEMDRGTLIEWRIDAGESVNEGDVIADIESRKDERRGGLEGGRRVAEDVSRTG